MVMTIPVIAPLDKPLPDPPPWRHAELLDFPTTRAPELPPFFPSASIIVNIMEVPAEMLASQV